MEGKSMAFLARMKDFFGFKEGQTLGAFVVECKTLTDKDKQDLWKAFNDAGLPTDPPSKS